MGILEQNAAGQSGEAKALETGVTLGRAAAGDREAQIEVGVAVAHKLEEKDPKSRRPLWQVLLFEEPWDWPKYWPKR